MCIRVRLLEIMIAFALALALLGSAPVRAEDAATALWQVSKASGEVWVATSGVQPASLETQATLNPGDSIRTGRTGRVLLTRGAETILVAPNSAITVPVNQKDAASTTILQQAGSIRLEVETRPERNFEVETPYLVAAVKGTGFTVTVGQGTARVDVSKGSVEVADLRSGQIALVMPGQSAKVTTSGVGGLSLGGAGALNPIRKGEPRAPSVQRLPVPKNGFSAPQGRQVRAIGNPAAGEKRTGGLHIGAALGEVKLDIHKVTNGLARDAGASGGGHRTAQPTVWSTGDLLPGNGIAKTYSQGNNGSGNAAGGANAQAGGNANAASSGNAGGNGNGNGGGNGLALGAGGGNGDGNGSGNGNDNNGKHLGQHK
jgi:FecR protein